LRCRVFCIGFCRLPPQKKRASIPSNSPQREHAVAIVPDHRQARHRERLGAVPLGQDERAAARGARAGLVGVAELGDACFVFGFLFGFRLVLFVCLRGVVAGVCGSFVGLFVVDAWFFFSPRKKAPGGKSNGSLFSALRVNGADARSSLASIDVPTRRDFLAPSLLVSCFWFLKSANDRTLSRRPHLLTRSRKAGARSTRLPKAPARFFLFFVFFVFCLEFRVFCVVTMGGEPCDSFGRRPGQRRTLSHSFPLCLRA